MRLVVVEPPAEVLDLAGVKAHVRAEDFDGDDALLEFYARAAEQHLAGPNGWLGRSIGIQTLELRLPSFCSRMALQCMPVIEVASVKYLDRDGVEQTAAPSLYSVGDRAIGLKSGATWPATATDDEAVRIRYRAGYEAENVPAPLVQAMKLLVGQWYRSRETVEIGVVVSALPNAVEALCAPYRIWS